MAPAGKPVSRDLELLVGVGQEPGGLRRIVADEIDARPEDLRRHRLWAFWNAPLRGRDRVELARRVAWAPKK